MKDCVANSIFICYRESADFRFQMDYRLHLLSFDTCLEVIVIGVPKLDGLKGFLRKLLNVIEAKREAWFTTILLGLDSAHHFIFQPRSTFHREVNVAPWMQSWRARS